MSHQRSLGAVCALFVTVAALVTQRTSALDRWSATSFDVPQVANIVIDGKADDWGTNGLRIDGLVDSADIVRPAKDFASHVRIGWDERGLLVLVRVTDDDAREADRLDSLWLRDCVEMFVADKVSGENVWQLLASPGIADGQPELRTTFMDMRQSPAMKSIPLAAEVKRTKTDDGYQIEALLPWKNLGISPEAGKTTVGFQIYVDDADRPKDGGFRDVVNHAAWYPTPGAGRNSKLMYDLKLAASGTGSSAPPAAWGSYPRFHETRVNVVGPADLAGKEIAIRERDGDERKLIAKGTFADDGGGGRAVASIAFPMPPRGKRYAPLTVGLSGAGSSKDGSDQIALDLDDPEPKRADAIASLRVVAKEPAFATDAFPAIDFPDTAFAQDILGPYKLDVAVYNREGGKVDSAKTSGKYGAIAEIKTDDGRTLRRFVSLYRTDKPFDLGAAREEVKSNDLDKLAKRLVDAGFDPIADKERLSFIAAALGEGRSAIPLPILFGALRETAATNAHPYTSAWGPASFDRDYWFTLQKKTNTFSPYKYQEFTPASFESDAAKRWPLLLIVHGSGAEGDDLGILTQKHVVPVRLVTDRAALPFVVVAPQCPRGENWNPRALLDLIDAKIATGRIDPDRIYVTGGSKGGSATWLLGATAPDRLAAMAPLCGGTDPLDATRLKDLPIWIFHGDHDGSVDIGYSNRMFDALASIGARTRYTIFVGGTHDIFALNSDLIEWFLKQSRGKPEQGPTTQPTRVPFVEVVDP